MWLLVKYRHTAPFSLKPSFLTSSGSRSLVIPTMYAIKLALIDAAFRAGESGSAVFHWVKGLTIRLSPPQAAVVTNTFIKIQKEARADAKDGEEEADEEQSSEANSRFLNEAFRPTMAYREFVILAGELTVAFEVSGLTSEQRVSLERLARHINYFGKRGGFVQWTGYEVMPELPSGFGFGPNDETGVLSGSYIVQTLDDFGPTVTYDAINSFSNERATLGRDRVLVPVAIPYRRVSSSRRYTLYRRYD